jgi:glycine cleavage system aminomethyltransferase T
VSALDFLSPDRARPTAEFRPVLRSSMERRQRDAGATFDERGGWLVPVRFPDEAERLANVGVADLSHLGKIEVRGDGDPADHHEVIEWYRIREGLSLVLCRFEDTFVLRSALARRAELVLDQTAAYAVLGLRGPQADAVLRRLTDLHELPASGSVGHVTGHVLQRNGGFWIVFAQEYGHFLWEVAVENAERFGGGPVGVDAFLAEEGRA